MKGIIFNLAEEVVVREHGDDVWDAVLEGAGVTGSYTTSATTRTRTCWPSSRRPRGCSVPRRRTSSSSATRDTSTWSQRNGSHVTGRSCSTRSFHSRTRLSEIGNL